MSVFAIFLGYYRIHRLLLARHEQRIWSQDTLVRTAALEALKSSVALVCENVCLTNGRDSVNVVRKNTMPRTPSTCWYGD